MNHKYKSNTNTLHKNHMVEKTKRFEN